MKIKNQGNEPDNKGSQNNHPRPTATSSRLKWIIGIIGGVVVLLVGFKMFTPQSPKQPTTHNTAVGMSKHASSMNSSSNASSVNSSSSEDSKSAQKVDDAEKEAAAKQKEQAAEVAKKIQAAKAKDAKSHGQNSINMIPTIKKAFTAYFTNPNENAAWPSARHKAVLKKVGDDITTHALDQLIDPTLIKNERAMSLVQQPNLYEPLEITATKGLNGYYNVTAKVNNYINSGKNRHIVDKQTFKYIVVTNHNKITEISLTSQ